VDAAHKMAAAQCVKNVIADARHDVYAQHNKHNVRQLGADLRQRAVHGAHAERDDIKRGQLQKSG